MRHAQFRPPFGLGNPSLQSILASHRIRALGSNSMLEAARAMMFEVQGGVRLTGSHSARPDGLSRGLVIMLHGWEGSIASTYMLATGRSLYRAGFDVFRLNYRDHGDSHHLNRGVFLVTRLDEVRQAVIRAAGLAGGPPVFLVGFSLGGNFALRLAADGNAAPIPGLARVVGVSPLMDPDKATRAIDASALFRGYFLKKWKRSLRRKQTLFPEDYDFGPALALDSVMAMTDELVARLGIFPTTADYFDAYTLTGDRLAGLRQPTSLIIARDDPVILFDDFEPLRLPPGAEMVVAEKGGHSGFISGYNLQSWYQDELVRLFSSS